jgi:ribosome-binding factor A
MDSIRQQKISRLIQKDLGEIFRSKTNTLGGMISVTQVRVSSDLGVAKVFLSIFGGDKEKIFQDIQEDKHAIRKTLAGLTKHQLRRIPELIFKIDDSADYAENIDRLLKE